VPAPQLAHAVAVATDTNLQPVQEVAAVVRWEVPAAHAMHALGLAPSVSEA